MADGGKSVLLEIINTKYKKGAGLLRLLSERLVWTPAGSDAPKISVQYCDIKAQRISSESSSKVQLQVVLNDGNTCSFHFTSDEAPNTARKERDQVKDLLAQLLPVHRKKANKELEDKNKILKENPELYQLYKDLVVSGVISPEEFWENRVKILDKEMSETARQSVGLSSALLAEMQPESHGCNEVKYNLNADTIESIFKTYPAVKRKHEEVVPHEMPEKEFWTRFFQSHYFHRDRVNSRPALNDMFTECAKKDVLDQLRSKLADFEDPLLDLTGASPLPAEGYGSAPVDGGSDVSAKSTSGSHSLFRRLNHHSLMVLQSASSSADDKEKREENDQNGKATEKGEPVAKKSRLRESVRYEDLAPGQPTQVSSLKIVDVNRYYQDSSAKREIQHKLVGRGTDATSAAELCKDEVTRWSPNLTAVLSSHMACHVLTEMSPGGALMNSTSNHNLQQSVPAGLQTDLKQQYNALSELLRHFWSCFPVKTQFLEEKVARMGQSLIKYKDVKLQQFRYNLPREHAHLADHLSEMLEAALTKYKAWQGKKSSFKLPS